MEADEYAGNFDAYRPDLAVLTSVEWDHPDVFADTRRRQRCIRGLDATRPRPGRASHRSLIANVGDPSVAALGRRLVGTWPGTADPRRR